MSPQPFMRYFGIVDTQNAALKAAENVDILVAFIVRECKDVAKAAQEHLHQDVSRLQIECFKIMSYKKAHQGKP